MIECPQIKKTPKDEYRDIFIPAPKGSLKTEKDYDDELQRLYKYVKNPKKTFVTNKELVLNDFQLFVKTYLYNHCLHEDTGEFIPFAQTHLDFVNAYLACNTKFLSVLKLPREFGKSTMLFFIQLFTLMRKEIHCVMYVSKTETFSHSMLKRVRVELEHNQDLIDDFGPFEVSSYQGDFVVQNKDMSIDCFFCGFGIGQSIRGTIYKSYRPTLCCCDDIDTQEICINKQRLENLEIYFKSELMGCVSINRWKVILVGNEYHSNMLLKIVSNMKNCQVFTMYALDSNLESTWPARFSTQALMDKRETLTPIFFNREYMHQPYAGSSYFPPEKIYYGSFLNEDNQRTIIYLDGSFTDAGDYKSVVILTIAKDKYYIKNLYVRQGTIESCLMWIATQYKELIEKQIYPTFYFDGTFYQEDWTLKAIKEIEKLTSMRLPGIPIKEVKNKVLKIESMSPYFIRDEIVFDVSLKDTPDMNEALNQLFAWRPIEHNKIADDFPDSLISSIYLNTIGGNKPFKHVNNTKFRF